jgi:hypothetical protein
MPEWQLPVARDREQEKYLQRLGGLNLQNDDNGYDECCYENQSQCIGVNRKERYPPDNNN